MQGVVVSTVLHLNNTYVFYHFKGKQGLDNRNVV